jgi:hypothetical protein
VYYAPAPVYYYSSAPVYVAPIGLRVSAPYLSLSIARAPAAAHVPAREEVIPPPRPRMPAPAEGTYPYDGGPANPVPMPQAQPPAPNRAAPPTTLPEGRAVSLQSKTPKYKYAAYGEKPSRPAATADQTLAVKTSK